ncbi:MAG: FHA domain-containing protein [Pyrinomonadaceae bacterium]
MANAVLIIHQPEQVSREVEFSSGVVSIGRALDNTVCLDGDTNVSRYHAAVEARSDGFYVSDLGSSNGTTLNDVPIDFERKLRDGDTINVGGATLIDVRLYEPAPLPEPEPETSEAQYAAPSVAMPNIATPSLAAPNLAMPGQSMPAAVAPAVSGPSTGLIVGAVVGGLLLTALVAGILIWKSSGGCNATVRILSPQSGETIHGPVTIRAQAEETKCIDRVIYQLDGVKVASSEVSPYDAVFDPADIQNLSGGNHILTAVVEDLEGAKTSQEETVVLAFENAGGQTVVDDTQTGGGETTGSSNQQTNSTQPNTSTVSSFDIKDMAARLAKQVSAKSDYSFDRDFIQQVQARTNEYAGEGYYERARAFRDLINDTFVGEQGLDAPLGYVIAMSRSKFTLNNRSQNASSKGMTTGDEPQGLWQIQTSLAQGTGYMGRCGTMTLADADQKCSAIVASMYTKSLDADLFAGDFVYAVACFGMLPKDAAQFRDSLPPDRRDFWKMLKSAEQKDRVARFFAAGIVCENPQKFGLMRDRALSNLYPKK